MFNPDKCNLWAEYEIPVRGVSFFNQTGHLGEALRNKNDLKYFSEPEEYILKNDYVHRSASSSSIPGIMFYDSWSILFAPLNDSYTQDDYDKRKDLVKCFSNYNPPIYKLSSGGLPAQIPFAKITTLLSIDRHGSVTKFDPEKNKWVDTVDGSENKKFGNGLRTLSGGDSAPKTTQRLIIYTIDFNSYSFRVCQEEDRPLPGLNKKTIRSFVTMLSTRLSKVKKASSSDLALEMKSSPQLPVDKMKTNFCFHMFSSYSRTEILDSIKPINTNPVNPIERLKSIWFHDFLKNLDHTDIVKNHLFKICNTYPWEMMAISLTSPNGANIKIQQHCHEFQDRRFPVLSAVFPPKPSSNKIGSVYLFRSGSQGPQSDLFKKEYNKIKSITTLKFTEVSNPMESDIEIRPESEYDNAVNRMKNFSAPCSKFLKESFTQLNSLIKLPQTKTSKRLFNKDDFEFSTILNSYRNSLTSMEELEIDTQDYLMPPGMNKMSVKLNTIVDEKSIDNYFTRPNNLDTTNSSRISPLALRRNHHSSSKSLNSGSKITREKTFSQVMNKIGPSRLMGKNLDQIATERTAHRSEWLLMFGETNWLQLVSLALKQSSEICQLILEEKEALVEDSEHIPPPQLHPRRNLPNQSIYSSKGQTSGPNSSLFILTGPGPGRIWQCVIVSLIRICMEIECRTLHGFEKLIEHEWVRLGYPFAPDLDVLSNTSSEYDECASFVLFLDAVHQMMTQYPTEFEFTQDYLVILMDSALSKGGGTPPFSVEFSSSCEAARAHFSPDFNLDRPEAMELSEFIFKSRSLSYFNQWQDKLTFEGLRLIPNWLYWWKYCKTPLEDTLVEAYEKHPIEPVILEPMYDPIAVLIPWHHAFLRWTRPLRIVNGGYSNLAKSLREKLQPKFQSSLTSQQWKYMTSSSPYSGWFSDEAIQNAILNLDESVTNHVLDKWLNEDSWKSVQKVINSWSNQIAKLNNE